MTRVQLCGSLVADALDYYDYYGERTIGAIKRLCYYYPSVGEPLAIRLLGRKLYRWSIVDDFIDTNLVRAGGSQSHAPPPTGGSSTWRARFAAFVRKRGPEYGPAIQCSLVAWYFPEAPNGNYNSSAERQRAHAVFRTLFPHANPAYSEFLNATTASEQDAVIQSLLWVRNQRMDAGVFKVLSSIDKIDAKADASDLNGNYDADSCALDVIGRLAGNKGYARAFAHFCRRRIAALSVYLSSKQADRDRLSEGGSEAWIVDFGVKAQLTSYQYFLRRIRSRNVYLRSTE